MANTHNVRFITKLSFLTKKHLVKFIWKYYSYKCKIRLLAKDDLLPFKEESFGGKDI